MYVLLEREGAAAAGGGGGGGGGGSLDHGGCEGVLEGKGL